MHLAFDEIEEAVAKTFSGILEREATVERAREAECNAHGVDDQLWKLLVSAGALEIAIPTETGGLLLAAIVSEMIGAHIAPVPFSEVVCAQRLIARLNDENAVLLSEIASGARVVTITVAQGWSAAESQLVPAGTVADATLVRDSNAVWLYPRPDNVVKPETLDGGSSALWATTASGAQRLASANVAEQLWSRAEADVRVLTASELVGMADRAIVMAAEYARTRNQFGRLIGSYQGVSHPLADSATAIEGARLLTRKAAWAVDTNDPEHEALASMAFVNAWEVSQKAVSHCLRVHGGYGFMSEYDIQLYYRRVKAAPLRIGSWPNELSRMSNLLYGYGSRA
jgi:alkylation response protein AidB-like acyl-CoA dehydrogenase